MLLASRSLWLAGTNTWIIATEEGGEAVIIDAPPDPRAIVDLVSHHSLVPVACLLTHGHIDHMGGAAVVAGEYGMPAYVHPDDDYLTLDPLGQLRAMFGMSLPGDWEPPVTRLPLQHGMELALAGIRIEVRHTPGHTPGHVCFWLPEEGTVFTGDQLFAGSIGRTDLPGGDLGQLAASMRERVMDLDDQTRVLPGHGPETTIGQERRTNPFRDLWRV
jgi:glyoxylase-like metal-dependent hydrolase (beta-lactamase superfamily II)